MRGRLGAAALAGGPCRARLAVFSAVVATTRAGDWRRRVGNAWWAGPGLVQGPAGAGRHLGLGGSRVLGSLGSGGPGSRGRSAVSEARRPRGQASFLGRRGRRGACGPNARAVLGRVAGAGAPGGLLESSAFSLPLENSPPASRGCLDNRVLACFIDTRMCPSSWA